ncbi:hypothetical protein IJG04_02790 [Candidatus Saccharibacteria bacterium]|nr:hypothetical protein [Candidatus Saccharibacteria bacterium]
MNWNIKRKLKVNRILVLVWGLFFGLMAIILTISLLSQEKVTTGSNTDAVYVKSLTCSTSDYLYPFFTLDESNNKELKIITIFEKDKLKTISLQQILYYDNDESIIRGETENHVAVDLAFADDGLESGSFGMNFARLHDGFRFGLYGTSEQEQTLLKKYFLLDDLNDLSPNEIKQNYEKLMMNCVEQN